MGIHPDQVSLGEISVKALWKCPVGLNPGDPAYQVNLDSVDLADCSDSDKMPAIGIVDTKPTPTTCYVVRNGIVYISGWNLLTKQTYFVGPGNGVQVAANIPTIPGTYIQEIGFPKARQGDTQSDVLVVLIDRDYTVR
jgi:hypothetical protein